MPNRRQFITAAGVAGSAGLVAGAFRHWQGSESLNPLGPLRPVADSISSEVLLELPPGFSYFAGSWRGEAMADGAPIPGLHDGMAAFSGSTPDAPITLLRNHEVPYEPTAKRLFDGPCYDEIAPGGVTRVQFDPQAKTFSVSTGVLSGTYMNCGGGISATQSWLTCEEIRMHRADEEGTKPHGYVFEVPLDGMATGLPIRDMGRFRHEAVCFCAADGSYILTEDESAGGIYRYIPDDINDLERGGQLQALALQDKPAANLDRTFAQGPWPITWVPVDAPEDIHYDPTQPGRGIFAQARAAGAALFKRPEGCWSEGDTVYFSCTSGGWTGMGQIFRYRPDAQTLECVYTSTTASALRAPDNICIREGAVFICEDHEFNPRLQCLTQDGRLFPVARNVTQLEDQYGQQGDFSDGEWAGVCFAGDWLFANLQRPGVTVAITGPWKKLLQPTAV